MWTDDVLSRTFTLQGYTRDRAVFARVDLTNRSPIYRSSAGRGEKKRERRGAECVTSPAYASKAARPGCVKGRSAEIVGRALLIWKANAE